MTLFGVLLSGDYKLQSMSIRINAPQILDFITNAYPNKGSIGMEEAVLISYLAALRRVS